VLKNFSVKNTQNFVLKNFSVLKNRVKNISVKKFKRSVLKKLLLKNTKNMC